MDRYEMLRRLKALPEPLAGSPSPRVELPQATPVDPKWTDELRIYGEGFVGRQDELAALDRAWAGGARIFTLHAEGGAGKTRVVVEWLRRMRDVGWPGAQRVFVHSFYSQGSDERRNATSELFFEHALAYFGYQGAPILQADERGRTLARLLVEHHGLLVLDGLEPLQHPTQHAEQGQLKDPGIRRLLLSLASVPGGTPGLCLITSRQPVVEIEGRLGATVLQQSLDHLHRDDGAALLRQFQVVGPDEELKRASDEFHGHAYSLMLLGSYLKTATDHHDIRRRREVVLLEEDPEHRNHARHMFAAYVRHLGEHSPEVAVLRLLGFFDRAAERELVDVLRAGEGVVYEWSKAKKTDKRSQSKRVQDMLADVTAPLLGLGQALPARNWIYRSMNPLRRRLRDWRPTTLMGEDEWHRVLSRLRELRLIGLTGPEESPALDAHPLLRECFAEQVRTEFPAAWQAGHQRLFEHLSGTCPYRPEGIEGLQPLYQAVPHGCLAGLHQQVRSEVYFDRILRGTGSDGHYSTFKLGAMGADLGAVACFFTKPWSTLAPTLALTHQAWLLNAAAFRLRALGRLSEAVEPLRAGLAMRVGQEVWGSAAIMASNLSELELTRGEVAAAVNAGDDSVRYADHSGNVFQKMVSRGMLADALHQAGRRDESQRLFEDAESWQAADQPEFPRLYSQSGFRYCDLLLSNAERAAWRCWLSTETDPSERRTTTTSLCTAVSDRAHEALCIVLGGSRNLLDIALNHLTLAQAALYQGQSAGDHIDAAVNGFRAAGDISFLPRGLLTRAWQRRLSSNEAGAQVDLDEAWEIAERGRMLLFQADIHLHRARLFHDRAALAEARRLIEKQGYRRRDGELADAEAAADGPHPWPLPRGAGEGNLPPRTHSDLLKEPEMSTTSPVSEAVPPAEDLLEELKRLPPAWFDELVFRLDTNNAVAGRHASQAARAMDLLAVVRVLDGGLARLQAEIQRLKGKSAPKETKNQVVREIPSEGSMRDQVFISYSHEDEKFKKELLKHLAPLSRSGAVTAWSDEQIAVGSQWFDEIQAALKKASVAVLLVSGDFFASKFINEHELGPLLKEAEAGGVRILWVPLRPSLFEETPLAKYQAVSPPNRPLSQMTRADRDEAWVRICKEIKRAVNP